MLRCSHHLALVAVSIVIPIFPIMGDDRPPAEAQPTTASHLMSAPTIAPPTPAPPGLVITDRNLAELASLGSLAREGQATVAVVEEPGGSLSLTADLTAAADAREAARKKWRRRYQQQLKRVAGCRREVDRTAARVASLARQLEESTDAAQRRARLLAQLTAARQRHAEAQTRLSQARTELQLELRDARREGAQPGWFRGLAER